jgi:hypothetical protein
MVHSSVSLSLCSLSLKKQKFTHIVEEGTIWVLDFCFCKSFGKILYWISIYWIVVIIVEMIPTLIRWDAHATEAITRVTTVLCSLSSFSHVMLVSMPPKAMCPGVTGLRADGIILLAAPKTSPLTLMAVTPPWYYPWLLAPTSYSTTFLLLTSLRRTPYTSLSSTPAVPPSYPLNSPSLVLAVRNFVLCSTDSPQLFSNENRIFSADPSPASGNTTWNLSPQCVCLCLLLASLKLD